tara:strand:+ start:248 stop:718 length:471 start_codon:yes stop_codon:yes gene_type:complete
MGGIQANILGQQAALSSQNAASLAGLFTGRGTALSGALGQLGAQRSILTGQRAGLETQIAAMTEGVLGRAAQGAVGVRSGVQHTAAPGLMEQMGGIGGFINAGQAIAGLFPAGGIAGLFPAGGGGTNMLNPAYTSPVGSIHGPSPNPYAPIDPETY